MDKYPFKIIILLDLLGSVVPVFPGRDLLFYVEVAGKIKKNGMQSHPVRPVFIENWHSIII